MDNTSPLPPSIGAKLTHDSAELHVQGTAPYVDDIPELEGTLHVALGLSDHAHAHIRRLNLDAVKNCEGVVATVTSADIPGELDIGPVLPGDPLFAEAKTEYVGQPLFAVAANDLQSARMAVKHAHIEYEPLSPILTIEEALTKRSFLVPEKEFHRMSRGDPEAAIANAPHRLSGEMRIGGQEHFYLEGQVAYAYIREDGEVVVYSSSQNPTEIQHLVANVLGLRMNAVTVEVRRMGGGFGGKETQAAFPACIAAVLAAKTKRPVKLCLPRAEDFKMTGKRHAFLNRYEVGFDDLGKIHGLTLELAADCGMSPDLSLAIVDRAMFHADNAYYLPAVRITGIPCRTNKASNTAFRGFGGPQGMLTIEKIVDDIARTTGTPALEVRRRNFYRQGADTTPYHQRIEDNVINEIETQLCHDADYDTRRAEVDKFNSTSPFFKKGLALTPIKFGIAFTTTFLNQGGALIHIYRDGSIHLNHGGTEMGQGLFIKVAQVVAEEFGVDLEHVKCSATSTDKVPNTSPTAASSSSDLNGKAAQTAARTIVARLRDVAAANYDTDPSEVVFADNLVSLGTTKKITFEELVDLAYLSRVSLSSTGYYQTPKVGYDRQQGRGRPFLYYTYGAAVSEVLIDTLTGEHKLTRIDILHDVGDSINPAIDIGQIEGGFAQGYGWLTCEELTWDDNGRLTTIGPATYKIPTASDMPAEFNLKLFKNSNREDTIFRSKAVGEPPLMLAISAWVALLDAVAATSKVQSPIQIDAPATPENVLKAINAANGGTSGR